jgi:hypothetical protein
LKGYTVTFQKPKPTDPRQLKAGDGGIVMDPNVAVGPLNSVMGNPRGMVGPSIELRSQADSLRETPWVGRPGKSITPGPRRTPGARFVLGMSGALFGFSVGRFVAATPIFQGLQPTHQFWTSVGMSVGGSVVGTIGYATDDPVLMGFGAGLSIAASISAGEALVDIAGAEWEAIKASIEETAVRLAPRSEEIGAPSALEFLGELQRRGAERIMEHASLLW